MSPPDIIRGMIAQPLPAVIVERWTGDEGWPVWRVYYFATHFGEDGERFIEVPDYDEALEVAGILAACSGWPVEVRGGQR